MQLSPTKPLLLLLACLQLGQTRQNSIDSCFRGDPITAPDPGLVQKLTKFSLRLFSEVEKDVSASQNVILSPFSVWSALVLTYLTSEGSTRQELRDVLRAESKIGLHDDWKFLEGRLTRGGQRKKRQTDTEVVTINNQNSVVETKSDSEKDSKTSTFTTSSKESQAEGTVTATIRKRNRFTICVMDREGREVCNMTIIPDEMNTETINIDPASSSMGDSTGTTGMNNMASSNMMCTNGVCTMSSSSSSSSSQSGSSNMEECMSMEDGSMVCNKETCTTNNAGAETCTTETCTTDPDGVETCARRRRSMKAVPVRESAKSILRPRKKSLGPVNTRPRPSKHSRPAKPTLTSSNLTPEYTNLPKNQRELPKNVTNLAPNPASVPLKPNPSQNPTELTQNISNPTQKPVNLNPKLNPRNPSKPDYVNPTKPTPTKPSQPTKPALKPNKKPRNPSKPSQSFTGNLTTKDCRTDATGQEACTPRRQKRQLKAREFTTKSWIYVATNLRLKSCLPSYLPEIVPINFKQTNSAAQTINAAVSEATGGRIDSLVQPQDLNGADLMLLNAVNFKGTWAKKFPMENTQKATFTTELGESKQVDMMRVVGDFAYASNTALNATVLELAYTGPYSLLLLQPDGVGVRGVLDKLNGRRLIETRGVMEKKFLEISLPRFTARSHLSQQLKTALSVVGVRSLFSSPQDLSTLTPTPIRLHNIIHEASIEVNEDGTEFAAATGIIGTRVSPARIRFNSPFVFLLLDNSYRIPIAAGVIRNP